MQQALAVQLKIPAEQLDLDASLLQLGLDSIDLMSWLHRFHAEGVELSLRDLYRRPSVNGWLAMLRKSRPCHVPIADSVRCWGTMRVGEAFPLTPVQLAYLAGRSPQQVLGGVGCYLYQEFDGTGLDPERLDSALQRLVLRHPMLSVAFRDDGTQVRLPVSSWMGLVRHDLRGLSEVMGETALLALRERLSHQLLDVEAGHCISFEIALLPEGRHRLFAGIDLLIADAASYAQLFDELGSLLTGQELPPIDPGYDFFSYTQQIRDLSAPRRESARQYWQAQLDSLPAAPSLPLTCDPAQIRPVRILRRKRRLEPDQWQVFKRHAGVMGLTPTMALASSFAALLSRWTGQRRLLLNLTLFDRHALNPAVARIVADFTNILLLDMDCEGEDFQALAAANQQAFADAYEHHDYSGVEVMRELKKRGCHPHGAPVVFTSMLGRPLLSDSLAGILGEPGWGISQTPQVWIDHMVIEQGGGLVLQWDCNEALFPCGLLDALFEQYVEWVARFCAGVEVWKQPLPDELPPSQRQTRCRVNATQQPLPRALLHEAFFLGAVAAGERPAIVLGSTQLSHAELAAHASGLSQAIRAGGVGHRCVSVSVCPKAWGR